MVVCAYSFIHSDCSTTTLQPAQESGPVSKNNKTKNTTHILLKMYQKLLELLQVYTQRYQRSPLPQAETAFRAQLC